MILYVYTKYGLNVDDIICIYSISTIHVDTIYELYM